MRNRLFFSLIILGLATLCFVVIGRLVHDRLGRADFFSGYTLAAVCGVLLLLPLRKKLMLLGLGKVALWQQVHHFAGIFSIIIFMGHVGLSIHGGFELTLALLFVALSFSGLGHWYVNRHIPKLLRNAGQPLRMEDIKPTRTALGNQAYGVALAAANNSESTSLAEFYTQSLALYFQRKRTWLYYASPRGTMRRDMLAKLSVLQRFLNDEGLIASRQLSELIVRRDDTDFQAAMMLRIRAWNLTHVTLTWLFVLFAAIHIIAVHRFVGG